MRQMKKTPMQNGRRDLFYVDDDFHDYVTGDHWTGGADGTGAVAVVADVPHGVVRLITSAAVDNDECWLHTTQECFLFQNVKPIVFEWMGYYTEVTADTANVFVGLMNALATTPMQDNGAGPKAGMVGFGFYRVDGGVVWNTIVENGTDARLVQALTLANTRNLAGEKIDADEDTLIRLRGEFNPVCLKSATILSADFDFWVNDVHVVHENCDMTLAQFTNMHAGMAIHNGDNLGALMLFADYMDTSQIRIDAI